MKWCKGDRVYSRKYQSEGTVVEPAEKCYKEGCNENTVCIRFDNTSDILTDVHETNLTRI